MPPAPAGAGRWDLVFAANLLHIAPPDAVAGLFRRAGEALAAEGRLMVYGPFAEPPQPLAPGNQAFDEALRARDTRWGLRPLDAVDAAAAAAGLERRERVEMPANNLLLVYGRRADGPLYQLRIEPDGLTLAASAGRNLLASALAGGAALPSACRGGTCRRCLMQLREGRAA
ncbi:DUF938 domain-containing protein [Piscinibacter sakaiensis]|uniref:DUF938 domain-containing protein n=1 Tax=Piscinibacter sakaiensis TaxID=1547922 RepID=UPI00372C391D